MVDLPARIDSLHIQTQPGALVSTASSNLVLRKLLRYDRFCFSKLF